MVDRITNRLKFQLERLLLRGAHFRLLFIALLMGVLSLTAGLLVYGYAGGFGSVGEAIWWAFLRLTDPGYLGDDEGIFLRAISTFLTVAGFVLFVGALIAILTQWLNQTMAALGRGYTPVALRNHIVILGWTNRTATIVAELLLSEGRVRRFLRRHGARGLNVAILAEDEPEQVLVDLRDRLGRLWDERKIILRTGTALRLEHLRRVDFMNAAAILLPAPEFSDRRIGADTQVIKTLLSLANHPSASEGRKLPLLVAEIFDAQKIPIARKSYLGRIELLASDSIISRLIAQNVRHRGLSQVYSELLTHGRGNEIYIREIPEFTGRRFHELSVAFPSGIPLGVARQQGSSFKPILNPPAEFLLEAGDRLVVMARSYDDSAPDLGAPAGERINRGIPRTPRDEDAPDRRILLLGWSHRIPALVHEFDSYAAEHFHIDIMSVVSPEERNRRIARQGAHPERVNVTHFEADFTSPADLTAIQPWTYDNIVFLGSDWLEGEEEADARTILGYLLVREMLPAHGGPEIIVELLDAENMSLFRRRRGEVLISPLILSHMLAQVALRPELRAVFDELFGPGGAEISFFPAPLYTQAGAESSFDQISRAAAARGEIALGIRTHDEESGRAGTVRLNPSRHHGWKVEAEDEVVVLTMYG
jgi:ion channel POLLUX/CASTOR